jgi:hypothetical protein
MKTGLTYEIVSLGDTEWSVAGDLNSNGPAAGDIFICLKPGILPSSNPPVNISQMEVGVKYQIVDLGQPWLTAYDTSWNGLGVPVGDPVSIGKIFTCTSNNAFQTSTDYQQLDTTNSFTVTESIGFDFEPYGGQPLPPPSSTAVAMASSVVAGAWYKFVGDITPKYLDGTVISSYQDYCGMPSSTQPDEGTAFVANANANGNIPVAEATINNIAPGMFLQITTLGSKIDWYTLGFTPVPEAINVSDIVVGTTYQVVTLGDTYQTKTNTNWPALACVLFLPQGFLLQDDTYSCTPL